jgi:hypothetical protein
MERSEALEALEDAHTAWLDAIGPSVQRGESPKEAPAEVVAQADQLRRSVDDALTDLLHTFDLSGEHPEQGYRELVALLTDSGLQSLIPPTFEELTRGEMLEMIGGDPGEGEMLLRSKGGTVLRVKVLEIDTSKAELDLEALDD